MTTDELLDLLDEAQQLLNHATNIEDRKRVRIRRDGLKAELTRCSGSALCAHEQASEQLHALELIVEQARSGVEAVRLAATGNGTRQGDNQVYEQLSQAVADMLEAHDTALKDIEDNRQRLGTFNITLFGRTMTGKSTLMEILTEGNGSTIGKGAQRATRDTRQYEWNGMKILDVPGVAAFGGSDDEQVAYEAARQADLILFLITDDAPQPAEAGHLAELRRTGNPVLGICNVKKGFNDVLGLRNFLKTQHSLFNKDRLDGIVGQFQEMQLRLGPGQHVEFKVAHLLSRFLADQPEYREHQVELYAASRFADIEDHIYREVTVNGSFHRQRSFLESTSSALFDIWWNMLQAGTSAWELHDRISDHASETRTWREGFRMEANARIGGLLNDTIGRLRLGIPSFVEANCEDREMADKWAQRVQSVGINERIRELQKDLHQRVFDKVNTLNQEMEDELRNVQAIINRPDLTTGPIWNHRRIWNLSAMGVSSALGIASIATGGFTPPGIALGIAAAIVGIVGQFIGRRIGNKAQRRQEAVAQITPELQKDLDRIDVEAKRYMEQWLQEGLIEPQLDTAIARLEGDAADMAQAAEFYRVQAASLNQQLLRQNRQLVETVLEHIGTHTVACENLVIARAPGRGIIIRAEGENQIAAETMEQLRDIIQEPVSIIPACWTEKQTIQWAAGNGTPLDDIRIDREHAIAYAHHGDQDQATAVRISLAQQLTGLHIRNSN